MSIEPVLYFYLFIVSLIDIPRQSSIIAGFFVQADEDVIINEVVNLWEEINE